MKACYSFLRSTGAARVAGLWLCFGMALSCLSAADRSLGTWERNTKESTSSGPDPWKRQTIIREGVPGGVRQTVVAEMKDGKKQNLSWTALYGGPPVGIEGAPPAWDTIRIRRINDRVFQNEVSDSRGGKYRSSFRTTISKDGRRMTSNAKGLDAAGKPMKSKLVYDRVP